jgi:hypothetical protein
MGFLYVAVIVGKITKKNGETPPNGIAIPSETTQKNQCYNIPRMNGG